MFKKYLFLSLLTSVALYASCDQFSCEQEMCDVDSDEGYEFLTPEESREIGDKLTEEEKAIVAEGLRVLYDVVAKTCETDEVIAMDKVLSEYGVRGMLSLCLYLQKKKEVLFDVVE